jgi:hypothetical protein
VRLHISPFSFFGPPKRRNRPRASAELSLTFPGPTPSVLIAGISLHWTYIMKPKPPNAALVWKQVDDFVVPRLRLNVIDRAVYSHLLRHTRLECRHRICFKQLWLAKGIGVCRNTARSSLRRLANRGAVRLIENSHDGHLVEVLLPGEIRVGFRESPDRPLLCRPRLRRSCAPLRPQSRSSTFSRRLHYATPSTPVTATLASTACVA